MQVVLKDGKTLELNPSQTYADVASMISPSFRKKVLAAKANGELVDLNREVSGDCEVEFVLREDAEAFEILNHSCAHLLAHAMKRLYPGTLFGVGPAIEEGFYYDFKVSEPVQLEDLPKIEEEMKKIVKESISLNHYMLAKDEAKAKFASDKFKCELIDAVEDEYVGIYEQGDFADVCRGPHVISTALLKNFKLLNVAGAYWRGDSNNEMLTRIYGTCWFTAEDLEKHLFNLEERKKRDHRKLGKDLELFMVSDFGPGFPFWLPKGMLLKNALVNFWTDVHTKAGYQFVQTPIMLNRQLWETSGHWFNYKENMYTSQIDENEFAVKPMNCPGGILVYKMEPHSYRDLPIRAGEIGLVHRHELSGALNGLMRVRCFHQDDAHIFMTKEQIQDEIKNVVRLFDEVYKLFGLTFHVELSTRPEDSMGSDEDWEIATEGLRGALDSIGLDYVVNEGDGAFYGPKIDFHLNDAIGRTWQCGTIQLDMQLPERFDLEYTGADGQKHRPVMIHRVVYGSIERFIGILIEHFAGAFPTWLAPVQAVVIPVSEAHKEYAHKVYEQLKAAGIRAEVDDRNEKMGYRIRENQLKKVPYMLVVGDKEAEAGAVAPRDRKEILKEAMSTESFIEYITTEIKERRR